MSANTNFDDGCCRIKDVLIIVFTVAVLQNLYFIQGRQQKIFQGGRGQHREVVPIPISLPSLY